MIEVLYLKSSDKKPKIDALGGNIHAVCRACNSSLFNLLVAALSFLVDCLLL
jgi:hypothetical protein